jgi:hypothetical protein
MRGVVRGRNLRNPTLGKAGSLKIIALDECSNLCISNGAQGCDKDRLTIELATPVDISSQLHVYQWRIVSQPVADGWLGPLPVVSARVYVNLRIGGSIPVADLPGKYQKKEECRHRTGTHCQPGSFQPS